MEEKIKEILRKTEKIVLNSRIKPELYSAAFNEVFRLLWSSTYIPKAAPQADLPPTINDESKKDLFGFIAKTLGVQKDRVRDLYHKDERIGIKLVKTRIPGKSNAEKQVNLMALTLLPNKILGREWMDTKDLTLCAKEMGVYDLSLSRNIQTRQQFFGVKGTGRGMKYRLKTRGEELARQLIRKLLGEK